MSRPISASLRTCSLYCKSNNGYGFPNCGTLLHDQECILARDDVLLHLESKMYKISSTAGLFYLKWSSDTDTVAVSCNSPARRSSMLDVLPTSCSLKEYV
jgi:hypothetical protein